MWSETPCIFKAMVKNRKNLQAKNYMFIIFKITHTLATKKPEIQNIVIGLRNIQNQPHCMFERWQVFG